jgi:hypothetical protein
MLEEAAPQGKIAVPGGAGTPSTAVISGRPGQEIKGWGIFPAFYWNDRQEAAKDDAFTLFRRFQTTAGEDMADKGRSPITGGQTAAALPARSVMVVIAENRRGPLRPR